MALTPLASGYGGQSLQSRLSYLNQSDVTLDLRLREAAKIFELCSLDSSCFSRSDEFVPLAIGKAILRWLVSQLDSVVELSSFQLHANFFSLLAKVLSRLPTALVATGLKNVPLLRALTRVLEANPSAANISQHHSPRASSSETLIGTEAQSVPSTISAVNLQSKRKADVELQDNSRKKSKVVECQHAASIERSLLIPISQVLLEIEKKIEGPPDGLHSCEGEHLLSTITDEVEVVASLFAKGLKTIRILKLDVGECQEHCDLLEKSDVILKPFLFLWQLLGAAETDARVEKPKYTFATCLHEALAIFPLFTEPASRQRSVYIAQLEDLVLHYAIKPAHKRYLSTKDPNSEKVDATIFDAWLGNVIKQPRSDFGVTGQSDATSQRFNIPEATFFELAIRRGFENSRTRSRADDNWLELLFLYLCGCLDTPSTPKLAISGQFEKGVTLQLLSLAKEHNLKVGRSSLEVLIRCLLSKSHDERFKRGDWEAIGYCIKLHPNIVIKKGHSDDETDLVQELLARTVNLTQESTSTGALSLQSAKDGIVKQTGVRARNAAIESFILPFLEAYIQTRRFDLFVHHWQDQLTNARAAIQIKQTKSNELNSQAESIWEDPGLISTVSSMLPSPSNQTKHLLIPLEPFLQVRDSQIELHIAQTHSSCIILSALIGGLNSEDAIAATRTEAQQVTNTLCSLIIADKSKWIHDSLPWIVLCRLCERWPELFLDNETNPDLRSLIKAATKSFSKVIDTGTDIANQSDASFAAFAFIWRLHLIPGSGKSIEAVQAAAKLSKLTKELLPVLRSLQTETKVSEPRTQCGFGIQYALLVMRESGPLVPLKSNLRTMFMKIISKLAVFLILEASKLDPKAPESATGKISISELHKYVNFEIFSDSPTLFEEARHILWEDVGQIPQLVDDEDGRKTISFILQALRLQDPRRWEKRQRDSIINTLITLNAALKDSSSAVTRVEVLPLLAHFLKKPLRDRDPSQARLRKSLEELRSATTKPADAETLEEHESVPEKQVAVEVQQLLGSSSHPKKHWSLQLRARELLGLRKFEATYTLDQFGEQMLEADVTEKEKIILETLSKCKTDKSPTILIFARKVCGARYEEGERTERIKTSLQKLFSQMLYIVAESQDMKRVILAERAVTTGLKKNSWATAQTHIDQCLACATIVSVKLGAPVSEETPSDLRTEPSKGRLKLDIASARRLVFGSLAVRNPKTKEEEARVRTQLGGKRGVNQPVPLSAANEQPQPKLSLQQDPKLPGTLYVALCESIATTLLHHRARIGGRWHLVVDSLRALLGCVFQPYVPSERQEWITGINLDHTHAATYARLLTMICDPSPSSVQPSKKRARQTNLHDPTKRARETAGQHLSVLLKDCCTLRLGAQLPAAVRTALDPGWYALLDAMGKEGAEALNELLNKAEREIFRAIFDEYTRFGKWQGG